jgi:hypothetical protein
MHTCTHAHIAGASLSTDWAVLHLQHVDQDAFDHSKLVSVDPLAWYCTAVGLHCDARVRDDVAAPTGWCSWYEHMHR